MGGGDFANGLLGGTVSTRARYRNHREAVLSAESICVPETFGFQIGFSLQCRPLVRYHIGIFAHWNDASVGTAHDDHCDQYCEKEF